MSQAKNVRVASPAKVSKPLSSLSPPSSPMVLDSEVGVPAPFTIRRSVDTSAPVFGRSVPRTIPSIFNIECESPATTTPLGPTAAPRSNIPVAIQRLRATPLRHGAATSSLSGANYTHRSSPVPLVREATKATPQSADIGVVTCTFEETLPELRRQRAAINPTPAVRPSSTASLGTPSTDQLPHLPSSGIRHSRALATALSDFNYERMEIASSPIVLHTRRGGNCFSRAGKDHSSSVSLPSCNGVTIADFSAPLATDRPSTPDQELQAVMDQTAATRNVGSPLIDVLHRSTLKVGGKEQSWITQQVPETAFAREATFTSLVSASTTSSFQNVELGQNVVPEPEYMVSLRAMAATPRAPSTGTVFQFRGVGSSGPANFRSCHSGSGSNGSVINYRKKVKGKAKDFQRPLLSSDTVGTFGAPTRVNSSTLAFSPSTFPFLTTTLLETTPNCRDCLSKGSLETASLLPSVPHDLTMDLEGTIKEALDWEECEFHKEQAATHSSGMHSQQLAAFRGVPQATTPTCQPRIEIADLADKSSSPLKREKSRVFSAQYAKIPGTDRVATVTRTPAEVITIYKRGELNLATGPNRMRSCTNPLRLADNPMLRESSHRREAPAPASALRSQAHFSRMAPSILSNSRLQTQVKYVFGEAAGSRHSPSCVSFHEAASPRHSTVVSSTVFSRRLSHLAISSSSSAAQRLPSPLIVPSCETAGQPQHSPFLLHAPRQLPKVENVRPPAELRKKPLIVIAPHEAGLPTIERPMVTPLPTAKSIVSAFDVTPPKMTWVERAASWGSKLRERVQTAEEQAKQRARSMRKKREIQSVAVHSPDDRVQVTQPPFRHSRLFSSRLKFEGHSKTQKPGKWTSIVQAQPLEDDDVFNPSSSRSSVARCSRLREGNTPAQLTPAMTRMSLESPRGECKERTRKRSWMVGQERVREVFRRVKKKKRD